MTVRSDKIERDWNIKVTGEASWVARLDLESTQPLSSGLEGQEIHPGNPFAGSLEMPFM